MHEDHECMQVLVLKSDTYQESQQIEQAEVCEDAHTVCDRWQMQWILKLKVFGGEFELVEKHEDNAVDDDAKLILPARLCDWKE